MRTVARAAWCGGQDRARPRLEVRGSDSIQTHGSQRPSLRGIPNRGGEPVAEGFFRCFFAAHGEELGGGPSNGGRRILVRASDVCVRVARYGRTARLREPPSRTYGREENWESWYSFLDAVLLLDRLDGGRVGQRVALE